MKVPSDWFGTVSLADTAFASAAFEKVDQVLDALQPTELDQLRSFAGFADAHVQINLHHISGRDWSDVDLHYTEDSGGMFNPLGHEEYYRLAGEPAVEQDALDDLTVVLTSIYTSEETWWRGRRIRTVVRQTNGGEDLGTSVAGWPLLPPRWLLPRDQLTTRRHTLSYGGHAASE